MNTTLSRFLPLVAALIAASATAWGTPPTNFFSGSIALDGDISDFFEVDGVTPKPGVCIKEDPTPLTSEAPLSGFVTKSGNNHPSGFNQRRIMSACNPFLNGGTIFVGIDLPGGTGSAANPNFVGPDGPTRVGTDGVKAIRPFDVDGNGEAATIGYSGVTPLMRCTDMGASLLTVDVIDCAKPDSTAFTDSVDSNKDPGNKERYGVTITFGDSTQVQTELYEDNTTAVGKAGLSVFSIPGGKTFGVTASRDATGAPVGPSVRRPHRHRCLREPGPRRHPG